MGVTENVKLDWYHHWVAKGFAALEAMLVDDPRKGKYCYGNSPGLADIYLVAQVFNANRFDCDMTLYPTLQKINDNCLALPEFERAAPGLQPDAK